MGKIKLSTIKIYAYHGCLKEEAVLGSDYVVDITVEADLSLACLSDNLSDTVDYVLINTIVKEEMRVKSKLLEHVAKRIMNRIFEDTPIVSWVEVSVSKLNPPINGDVAAVSVILESKRI